SGDEKLEHFLTADVFLSASCSEGFSRSLLEAMAVGLPLVLTPVGAHREVLDSRNGSSFVPRDRDGLAEALISMLDRDDRRVIGRRNRELVQARFTIDIVSREFVRIVEETIAR